MQNIKITNISVFPIMNSDGRLKGIAKIVLNDAIQLTNLKIYDGSGGLFVSYPVEFTQKNEEFRQIFYPVSKEFREYVELEVLNAYNEAINAAINN